MFVHDEAVDFRMLAHRAHIGGNDDVHEGDLFALVALGGNVTRQLFVIHLVLQENLGVASHGHEVGGHADNGINVADPPSVRSIAKHGILPFMGKLWPV